MCECLVRVPVSPSNRGRPRRHISREGDNEGEVLVPDERTLISSHLEASFYMGEICFPTTG